MVFTPTDWEGAYTLASQDFFGGDFKVCVTNHASKYYGQGVMANVGYFIGEIDANTNNWTGSFIMAGKENRTGTFSFQYSSGFSGTITEISAGGTEREVTIPSTSQSSSQAPSDLECFRQDTSILDGTAQFSFTGEWTGSVDSIRIHQDSTTDFISASYDYQYSNGVLAKGSEVCETVALPSGKYFASCQFYENGESDPYQGIELLVAKDSTSY